MTIARSLVWFQQDLRTADNPAFTEAALQGAVIPAYIYAPEDEGAWPPGAASRYWLHQSLAALDRSLRAQRLRLILRRGPIAAALCRLASETGARAVYWNRRYEPGSNTRDAAIADALHAVGVETHRFEPSLLFRPEDIRTKQGGPYKVFTQFWRTCLASAEPSLPTDPPACLKGPRAWPPSEPLASLGLEPRIDWAGGIRSEWCFGEAAAAERLQQFIDDALDHYDQGRDLPGEELTSRLSPYLHFGEISPRQVWHAVAAAAVHRRSQGNDASARRFLTELGWREFAHHLLVHFPETPEIPLRQEFRQFAWQIDSIFLEAWQQGRTGYPIVDAGMRELWATGWMHNRVRMIVASFLVKDLRISWQEGARWFWDTLVDADLANNTFGWQWSAGCGADAAPYFRIFNPVAQGKRFDPHGAYVRRWIPELAALPDAFIQCPWEAPPDELARARVVLGRDYPRPIVGHRAAREAALLAFKRLRVSR